MPIKRLLAAALAALCLCSCACAQEDGLNARMESFIEEYNLSERSFSLCYYNTVTGEKYRYNPDTMMMAASTYKLPLNMYYYEMEARGEIDPKAFIPNSGMTLDKCHELSLQHSDNDSSIALLYNLGNFRTYKDCMRTYFSAEEVPLQYYADNYYSTAMMMDALKYLYEHEAEFSELIGYLKLARPGEYFKRYITDCEIAHKYGSFEGAENDVGIIYAKQPFLLAVYTQGVGENISARAAELLKQYTDEQYEKQLAEEERLRKEAEEAARRLAQARDEVLSAKEEASHIPQTRSEVFPTWVLGAVSLGSVAAAIVLLLLQKRQKVKK